jgi:hypothetical protein
MRDLKLLFHFLCSVRNRHSRAENELLQICSRSPHHEEYARGVVGCTLHYLAAPVVARTPSSLLSCAGDSAGGSRVSPDAPLVDCYRCAPQIRALCTRAFKGGVRGKNRMSAVLARKASLRTFRQQAKGTALHTIRAA